MKRLLPVAGTNDDVLVKRYVRVLTTHRCGSLYLKNIIGFTTLPGFDYMRRVTPFSI